MGRWRGLPAAWLTAALLAGASSALAAQPDAAKLAEARSLVAEAVMLDHAQAAGRVTGAYAEALRDSLRDDFDKLTKDPQLGAVAGEALSALAGRDTAALAALRDRLVALERSHGRAD